MNEITSFAIELIEAGFSVLPVNENKRPAYIGYNPEKPYSWDHLKDEPMDIEDAEKVFKNAWGIGLIMGEVSGGAECIDFDAHEKDINEVYKRFVTNKDIQFILNNGVYTENTQRGGYHLIYRYECDDKRDGSQPLARWENGETMIETRGESSYVIIAPSPKYTIRKGSLLDLKQLQEVERDALIDYSTSFNKEEKKTVEQDFGVKEKPDFDNTDPVSYFNWEHNAYAKKLLQDIGWTYIETDAKTKTESWRRPGKNDGVSATWGNKHNALYIFSSSVEHFKPLVYYTPFQILVKLRFKGHYNSAISWIVSTYFNESVPYVRVGTDYYKIINKHDRYGLERTEMKVWKKDEIKQDHGKDYMQKIPLFDDFTIEPNNFCYVPVIKNCYNLYKPFNHNQKEGDCKWSKVIMKHVFGDQLELGYRYLQALYLHPKRMLPILTLVSKERQTGKTTFINWLNMIFGDNMTNIGPEDLVGSFNHIYATANIIAVEETLIEKSITVEKIKSLATGKFLTVNQKYVSHYKVPFYGKIILASNNEDKFAKIDEDEIRFFIRKLGVPTMHNHNIEEDLMSEIPAFLHLLASLPKIDWSRDRTGFTPEEIANDSLNKVKEASKSSLYKNLEFLIKDWFYNNDWNDELVVTPKNIKNEWFLNNNQIDFQYISAVIRNEFNIQPSEKTMRFSAFGVNSDIGKPFTFYKKDFIKDGVDVLDDDGPDVLPFGDYNNN